LKHTLIDAYTIKVLRAECAALAKKVAALSMLNTSMRNENARLRREIERLIKAGEKMTQQRASGRKER
jgi:hypothetical protein